MASKNGTGFRNETLRRYIVTAVGVTLAVGTTAFVLATGNDNAVMDAATISQFLVGNLFVYVFPALFYSKALGTSKTTFQKVMIKTLIIVGVVSSLADAIGFTCDTVMK